MFHFGNQMGFNYVASFSFDAAVFSMSVFYNEISEVF